jgi:hypothetical protein
MPDNKRPAFSRKIITATCLTVVGLVALWTFVLWPLLSAHVANMAVAFAAVGLFAVLGWLIPSWLGLDLAPSSGSAPSVLAGVALCAALGALAWWAATAFINLAVPLWTILPLGAAVALLVVMALGWDWD